MTGTVAVERAGPVVHVTLNRPDVRNAMSLAMVSELRDALGAAETDGAVRIVVLRGAGGHFSAGADLKDMTAARPRDEAAIADVSARFGELCAAFARSRLATIGVFEGSVMGGGLGLACVVDLALAADTASFRLPETQLGVVPAQIAPFLVERLGYSEAKRLAVSAGSVDAAQALALRLVHEVHPAERLDAALAAAIGRTLSCAPGAVAATKALLAKARFAAPESLVDEAAGVFARAALGPEGVEGMAAFLQKRKPSWAP